MNDFGPAASHDLNALLRNAELRNALEPYFDDAIMHIDAGEVPTEVENEYLESMLAWEKAPVLPIAEWFTPKLQLPLPETLDDETLHDVLWSVVQKLYDKRIVLDFTDHLNDRQLYCLIYRDILPSPEKKIDSSQSYLHWDCADASGDAETWLRYYATEEDRDHWADEYETELPPSEPAPFPRDLPRDPE